MGCRISYGRRVSCPLLCQELGIYLSDLAKPFANIRWKLRRWKSRFARRRRWYEYWAWPLAARPATVVREAGQTARVRIAAGSESITNLDPNPAVALSNESARFKYIF